MTTLYTVARRDGEDREYNLTAADAARSLLHDDGGEYDIRPATDDRSHRHDIRWRLWTRRQVAGIGWTLSGGIYSFEQDFDAAEADIFAQVIAHSQRADRGPVAEDQDAYRRSLDAMRAEEDDPECIERIDAELAQMDDDEPITLNISERERDTILAALRYWQREGLQSDGFERKIAENSRTGDDAALTGDEIDYLCEQINT